MVHTHLDLNHHLVQTSLCRKCLFIASLILSDHVFILTHGLLVKEHQANNLADARWHDCD